MALDSRPPYSEDRSIFSLAIQVYERDRSETTSKATRSVWANALEYAFRHKKKPDEVREFFFGFRGIVQTAKHARDPAKIHYWAMTHQD